MKLDELFSFPVNENEDMISATENYIITRLTSLKAEGRITSITTDQLNKELQKMQITTNIMPLDPTHLEEFLNTLEVVEDVRQIDDTEDGQTNFEVFLKYRHDKDADDIEKAQDDIESDAKSASKERKKDDEKAASKAADNLEL